MTIIMLVWCIWLSVCVSGSDLPPFPVGGLDLPVGTGNPSWCIVCVCQRTPPLAVRYYELWRSEWLRDIRVDTVLQMQHVVDRVELAELRRMCSGPYRKWNVQMGLTCELSRFRSDESACEGEEIVSSELRWYGNAGGQGCARQWRAGGGLLLPP